MFLISKYRIYYLFIFVIIVLSIQCYSMGAFAVDHTSEVLQVTTKTLSAKFWRGNIVFLQNRLTGHIHID